MQSTLFNTQTIQLMCMLISICVVVFFFIRQYTKGQAATDTKSKEQKLHTFYISGILVFIIIELVTGICMGSNQHSEILSYVSFAATLSSLIMSVVAIIFTIVTSNRGDEQYKKIDNASDKVTDSLNRFAVKTSDFEDSVSDFKTIARDLSAQMDNLFKEMGGTHDEVSEVKRMIAERQGHLEEPIASGKKKANEQEAFVNSFVSFSSFNGNLALYACALAKDNDKSFAIKQIVQGDISYTYGFLVASISAGIIVGNVGPDDCHITDYLPGLKERIITAIDNYINRQTDDGVKTRLKESKKKIEDLFV